MTPKPLRVGLLGTGIAPNKLYLAGFQKLAREGVLSIVACANRRRQKAERYAKLAKIPKVVDTAEELFALPEVEAVVISLPIDLQPRYVLAALAAGKPVISEKPVGPNVAEARKLVRAARRFDLPWIVGENFAFMPHTERLTEWVKRKKLGEVRLAEVRQLTLMDMKSPYFHTAWRQDPKYIGGFVADAGVHLANVVRRAFGMPVSIKNLTAQFDSRLAPIDTAVAALEFESGALGTWTSCFTAHYTGPMLRVYGARANAELTWNDVRLFDPKGKEISKERFPKKPVDSFEAQFRHFADVVRNGTRPVVTPEDALQDLIFLDGIVRQ